MMKTVSFALKLALGVSLLWSAPPPRALAAGVVGTGTPASCTDAALNAALAGGGAVSFNCGAAPHTIYSSLAKMITLDTTIDGGGTITLDGQDGDRLFVVSGGAVLTLRNIVLAHGFSSGDGGAIYNGSAGADTPGAVILENSTIRDSLAGASGGAIVSTGPMTITNSLLEGNSALNGGALYPRFTGARTTIITSILRDNTATDATNGWGGAMLIWDGALVTIEGGEIVSNSARVGGGIFNHAGGARSQVDLRAGAVVRDNLANPGYGGGIYSAGQITITDGLLAGNRAGNGGALYLVTTAMDYSAVISNTIFQHNHAMSTTEGYGGAILTAGDTIVSIRGGEIFSNTARQGGGIFQGVGGLIFVEGPTTIRENVATALDGGGVYNAGALLLTGALISGNRAQQYGGGIKTAPGADTIVGLSTISGNRAYGGGGLDTNGGTVSVNSTAISGNVSTSVGGGGGLHIVGNGQASVSNSTLSGNSGYLHGGAIDVVNGTLSLYGSTLLSNGAYWGGGVNVEEGGHGIIENVTLSGNTAPGGGGGLFVAGNASLRNVTFYLNAAATGGGLYVVVGRPLTLTNVIIAGSRQGGNCSGTITSDKYSLSSDNTCALGGIGSQNNVDPLLTALGNYGGPTQVHMLGLGSPAIDGVSGSDAPGADQRSKPRPQGGGYDIGAVERQPTDSDLAPRVYMPLLVR